MVYFINTVGLPGQLRKVALSTILTEICLYIIIGNTAEVDILIANVNQAMADITAKTQLCAAFYEIDPNDPNAPDHLYIKPIGG